jgi:hypothetical protein
MAAGATYEPISTTTLGSAAASVSFTSISGSYTDLIIVGNWSLSTGQNILLRFNSDSGTNYSETDVGGDGSSASSGRDSNRTDIRSGYNNGSDRSMNIINIMNYSNSTTYKTVILRWNTSEYVFARVGLWRSTSAITSISLTAGAGNINSGSTFTLYGVAAA